MNYSIKIDPKIYKQIRDLLQTGVVTHEGHSLDFSSVQSVSLRNGAMTFSPPPKITAAVGPIKLRTTISSLELRPNGVFVEIDNSPINVEFGPDEVG